jgi:hypothetical protein
VVLQALEPGAHDRGELVGAAGGEVAQPALEVRPHAFSRVVIVQGLLDNRA